MDRTDSVEDLVVDTVLCAYGNRGRAEFARLVEDLLQWLDNWDDTNPAIYRIPAPRTELARALARAPSLVFICRWDRPGGPSFVGALRPAECLANRLKARLDLSDQHKTEGG